MIVLNKINKWNKLITSALWKFKLRFQKKNSNLDQDSNLSLEIWNNDRVEFVKLKGVHLSSQLTSQTLEWLHFWHPNYNQDVHHKP